MMKVFNDESESSFNSLKDKLTQAPILVYPCIHKPFILDTDTSGFGIGAVLSQRYDGLERPVAYFRLPCPPGENKIYTGNIDVKDHQHFHAVSLVCVQW
jgi:hypothetical protein